LFGKKGYVVVVVVVVNKTKFERNKITGTRPLICRTYEAAHE